MLPPQPSQSLWLPLPLILYSQLPNLLHEASVGLAWRLPLSGAANLRVCRRRQPRRRLARAAVALCTMARAVGVSPMCKRRGEAGAALPTRPRACRARAPGRATTATCPLPGPTLAARALDAHRRSCADALIVPWTLGAPWARGPGVLSADVAGLRANAVVVLHAAVKPKKKRRNVPHAAVIEAEQNGADGLRTRLLAQLLNDAGCSPTVPGRNG